MYTVRLTPKVSAELHTLLSKGKCLVRVAKKARCLQLVADGMSAECASKMAGISPTTGRKVCRRFATEGLHHALFDLPRPGHAWLMTSKEEATIAAMVCASPPQGLAKWSITVIAKETVARGLLKRVSRATIGRFLNRHALKPWREKNVVRGGDQRQVYSSHGRRLGVV
jgi:putative transposase